jgi:hypothetical protein
MPKEVTQYINNFKFSGSGICTYLEYIGKKSQSSTPATREKNVNNGFASGVMTKSAKRRVKKYLDLWFNSIFAVTRAAKNPRRSYARFLTFVTLTLPSEQAHDDKFIKRNILTPFLATLQRLYNVNEYLWKAELQNNGNIHFHVLIDQYIHWAELRSRWNYTLQPYGYISNYTEKRLLEAPLEIDFLTKLPRHDTINCIHAHINSLTNSLINRSEISDSQKACIERFSGYLRKIKENLNVQDIINRIQSDWQSGFQNPNSTDIHAPHKIRNLCAYVTKYVCKKETKRITRPAACGSPSNEIATIQGRVWGCSDGLRTLTNFLTTECPRTKQFLTYCRSKNLLRHFDGDFFSFDAFNLYELLSKYCRSLFIELKDHFRAMYYKLYPPGLSLETINF